VKKIQSSKDRPHDCKSNHQFGNSAFDVVRRSEDEILASAPKLFSKKRSYNSIAFVIFYADAFSHGENPEDKLKSNETLRPTPFDDFIYLYSARILMKFDYLSQAPEPPSYPMPAFPMKMGYVSRPELLGTEYMNKKEKEDALLSQFMMGLDLYDDLCKTQQKPSLSEHPPPAEDELSTGLRKLRKDGTISVTLVFTARIFLDLHDILALDLNRAHQDLVKMSKNIQTVLESTGVFSSTGTAICWLNKDTKIVSKLSEISRLWVTEDRFRCLKYERKGFEHG
jgi:hypothetical protein